VEQELPTLPEHLSSPWFLVGSCYLIFSFMCMFCRSLFVLFLLAIVLSVLLRYTDYDYPFDIFKLFLQHFFRTLRWTFLAFLGTSQEVVLWEKSKCHNRSEVSKGIKLPRGKFMVSLVTQERKSKMSPWIRSQSWRHHQFLSKSTTNSTSFETLRNISCNFGEFTCSSSRKKLKINVSGNQWKGWPSWIFDPPCK
jgi:hypothetical protein